MHSAWFSYAIVQQSHALWKKKKSQGYNTFLQIHQDKNLQYKLGDTAGNVFVTINNFDNQIDRQFSKVYST